MSENGCEEVRKHLALGHPEAAASHLAGCDACRLEASRLSRVIAELAENASMEPPARLDAMVRQAIHALGRPSALVRRQTLAAALACGALAAMVSGFAVVLAETPLGSSAPAFTFALVIAYLAVSSTAMLPLLLARSVPKRPAREVRP